jgi:hypothetical protein
LESPGQRKGNQSDWSKAPSFPWEQKTISLFRLKAGLFFYIILLLKKRTTENSSFIHPHSNDSQTFSQKKTINGYKETGQYLTYQGTSFEVLCLEDNFNIELFKEPMSTLHVKNFNPRFFTQAGSEER